MIRISNLHFEFPAQEGSAVQVLDGIDLTIADGESVALMGPNGSGKTTLARCLNGLLQPTGGDVLVDGLNSSRADDLNEIRRRVGMVFQNPENQIVSTTVEREIAFGLENLGIEHDEMHRIVDEMLRKFGLECYRTHAPHLLSGGEMQRLALAAVMAMSPKYIVFDEPTSFLDAASRKAVFPMIRKVNKENNVATLFITQSPEETLHFGRLLILHRGKIVRDGVPSEIFADVAAMQKIGLNVPAEYEVNFYLQKFSDGKLSLNPSDFLPIL